MSHCLQSGWREIIRERVDDLKRDWLAGLVGTSVFAGISLIKGKVDGDENQYVDDGIQSAVAGWELFQLWGKDEVVELDGRKRRKVTSHGSALSSDECDKNGLWWESLETIFQTGAPVQWIVWPSDTSQEERALCHMGRHYEENNKSIRYTRSFGALCITQVIR